jgi:hypothetical protein
MKPVWRQVVFFLVALACATAALVAAGLEEEGRGSDAIATSP